MVELELVIKEINKRYHDEFDCDWDEGYVQCSRSRMTILVDDFYDKLNYDDYCTIYNRLIKLD